MFVTCSSLNVCVLFCDTQSSEAVFFGLRIRSLCHLLLTWVVGRWKRASEVEMMYFHRLRLREPISFVFSDECGKHSQFHKPSPIEVDFFLLLALPHYLVNGIFFHRPTSWGYRWNTWVMWNDVIRREFISGEPSNMTICETAHCLGELSWIWAW